jgi:hypothetical protein
MRDLGMVLGSLLTMKQHGDIVTRSSFYHLHQLRSVPSSLTLDAQRTIVQAFIISRIEKDHRKFLEENFTGELQMAIGKLQQPTELSETIQNNSVVHDCDIHPWKGTFMMHLATDLEWQYCIESTQLIDNNLTIITSSNGVLLRGWSAIILFNVATVGRTFNLIVKMSSKLR